MDGEVSQTREKMYKEEAVDIFYKEPRLTPISTSSLPPRHDGGSTLLLAGTSEDNVLRLYSGNCGESYSAWPHQVGWERIPIEETRRFKRPAFC